MYDLSISKVMTVSFSTCASICDFLEYCEIYPTLADFTTNIAYLLRNLAYFQLQPLSKASDGLN